VSIGRQGRSPLCDWQDALVPRQINSLLGEKYREFCGERTHGSASWNRAGGVGVKGARHSLEVKRSISLKGELMSWASLPMVSRRIRRLT